MKKLITIIVSAAAVFTMYAATTMAEDSDLVLEYNFDENDGDTVRDTSSNELHAVLEDFMAANDILVKSPIRVSDGKFGKALQFNGDGMLKVGGSPSAFNDIKSYTLMAWVWYTWDGYTPNTERRQEIIERVGYFWMNIRKDTKLLRVGFNSGEPCYGGVIKKRMDSNKPIQEKTWTHVAATFDYNEKSIEIYIDGKKATGKEYLRPNCNTRYDHHPVTIGGKYDQEYCPTCPNPDAFFKGKIDEVRIFSKALEPKKIEDLMLHMLHKKQPQAPTAFRIYR
jgi:hypothetical protein